MDSQRESERYRAAAEATLDPLTWCVRYLERIRKPAIADVVSRNCEAIRREMQRRRGGDGGAGVESRQ
jgi:hypothetical protein